MAEGRFDDALDLRSGAPGRCGVNATSADSTFGFGRNTSRETGCRPVRSVASWTSTETEPYALVAAARRSGRRPRAAPSRTRARAAAAARLSATTGVAMLYGRFATSLCGGGSSAAMSRRSASPQWTSVRGMPARCGSSRRSTSAACTCATRSARNRVSTPSPGPISSTTSAGSSSASRSITPRMFSSTRKCWPRLLRGATLTGEDLVCVRVDLRLELGRVDAARLGERGERVHHVGRLVALAAHRLRREIRAVGLGEQALRRYAPCGGAQVVGVLVGDVAGERDVPAAFERGVEQRRRGEAVEDHRRRRGRAGGRACRRRRRACG